MSYQRAFKEPNPRWRQNRRRKRPGETLSRVNTKKRLTTDYLNASMDRVFEKPKKTLAKSDKWS